MNELELKSLYKLLGAKIKELRLNRGFNQEDFAKLLNLTRASIVNIEQGRQRVSIHLLYDICKIANVSIKDILPDIQRDDNTKLSSIWKKKIESAPIGDKIRDQRLENFLIEITSKKQDD